MIGYVKKFKIKEGDDDRYIKFKIRTNGDKVYTIFIV